MITFKPIILVGAILLGSRAYAAQGALHVPRGDSIFRLEDADYRTSPYTGMTRKHWKDAALYLLSGAFSYVKSVNSPMSFPKQAGVSYPKDGISSPTEKMEGLCRTLFLAAPLLRDEPELRIGRQGVAAYYRYHLKQLTDSSSAEYIEPRAARGGPSQKLVEFGGLALSLTAIPEILWDPLAADTKEKLAKTMLSYADGPTVPSNWRFFNIFVMSFLKSKGYAVNEGLLQEYLQLSLKQYRGQGWYNDNPAYDYYSMWAFQMYGMLWSHYYGGMYPEAARQFKANFTPLKDNYPYMFSRKGQMIMWGRSITYRMGAIIPFPLTALENDPATNYGWLRRISSGVILQFLQHPELMKDSVPTLGFYGPFDPAVQPYSCRGSVYWMGKGFLGLLVPAASRFWTDRENEGPWKTVFKKTEVYNKFQEGSGQLITDYPGIGAAEIRSWCHVKFIGAWEKFRSSANYNRLAYNSAFPWQEDGKEGEVAMNYLFKNDLSGWEPGRLFTFRGYKNGVYRRTLVQETDTLVKLELADIPLPSGILRVDRYRGVRPTSLRLGHYSLPAVKGPVKRSVIRHAGREIHIINNGLYQLALVPLRGWAKVETIDTQGLHPEADRSTVINVQAEPGADRGNDVLAVLMLWKTAAEKFTSADFDQVRWIREQEDGGFSVMLNNKQIKVMP